MTDDDPTDPRHYLTQAPTPRAEAIVAATARDLGEAAPIWMVGALADRGEQIERRIVEIAADAARLERIQEHLVALAEDTARLDRIERAQAAATDARHVAERDAKRTRGYLWKAAVIAAGLLAPSLAWFLHARETAAAGEQRALDLIDQVKELREDIREIRGVMHRLGINTTPTPTSDMPGLPEKLSALAGGQRIEWDRGAGPPVTEPAQGQRAAFDVAAADEAACSRLNTAVEQRAGCVLAGGQDQGDQGVTHRPVLPCIASVRLMEWLPARLRPEGIAHDRSNP